MGLLEEDQDYASGKEDMEPSILVQSGHSFGCPVSGLSVQ